MPSLWIVGISINWETKHMLILYHSTPAQYFSPFSFSLPKNSVNCGIIAPPEPPGMVPIVRKIIIILLLLFGVSFTDAYAVLKANFTISGTSGCGDVVSSFTNTSTGAVSYFWSFGNGNTSTSTNPGAIYVTPGSYTVMLVAKDASGNTDTMIKVNAITVLKNPNGGFKTNVVSGCAPLSVGFTDTTGSGSGAITSWDWDFGDGSVSSAQSPTHTYVNPGTYTISQVLNNASGCKSTVIRTGYISVVARPVTNFSANKTQFCDSTGTVLFQDNSVNEIAGKTTWLWRFGDGTTSTLQNPSHKYINYGNYKVTLVINVSGACTDSAVFNNYIGLNKFKYDFTANVKSGCGLFTINFTNKVTPFFTWINLTWDFGDGTTSTLLNPSHIYADSGSYTVSLIVNGTATGCIDTVVKKKYINVGIKPTADFLSNDSISCKFPFVVKFTNKSKDGAAVWDWDFGDGSAHSTAKNPTHTYNSFGKFTLTLVAKTIEGCTDTKAVTDMMQVVKPQAIINIPVPRGCKVKNNIQFFDNSISQVPIKSRIWYFGDGDTSQSQNPVHSYADTGKYTVSLVVKTADTCMDSTTYGFKVKIGLKPKASFTASPLDSCIQFMNVQFKNFSDTFHIKPDEYLWDFGDGFGSNAKNPKIFYDDPPRKYTVRLIAYANGCADTLIRRNYINVHGPKAIFSFSIQQCTPDSAYFTNKTLGGNKYSWDFGDGSPVSSVRDPHHWYTTPGTYKVILHAFDTVMGCRNDTNLSITVPDLSKDAPGFQSNVTSGCYPVNVNFTDTTLGAITWNWDFGNGQSSTLSNASVAYAEPGLYTVKLKVVNGKGCTKTLSRTNYIKAFGVSPSFDICSAQECGTGSVKFTDFTYSPDPVSKRVWSFGDGQTLTTTDSIVTHSYSSLLPNQNVGYTVRLTVTDSAGCSAFKEDRIRQTKPIQKLSISSSPSCGAISYFINAINTISAPVGPLTYTWKWEHDAPVSGSSFFSKFITDSGVYHITLVYTDYYGCKDSVRDSVHARISKPKAGFSQSDTFSSCPPLEVLFTDTSKSGNTAINSYKWDFGDGTKSIFQNPKKLFVLPGKYTISLTITDLAGCVSTVSKTTLIHIKGPTGTYSFTPTKGCDSVAVTFTAHSTNANKLQWDLGDGTIVNDSNFSHTYHQKDLVTNGIFSPRLILSDTLGCKYAAPAFDTVRVWAKEIVKIRADDSIRCDTGQVKFADSTFHINKVSSWHWDFGDGSVSALRNPVHAYHTYDTFTVKLVITDSTGCSDSIVKKKWIAVAKQVKPKFGTSALGQCQQQSVEFTDSSTSAKFPLTKHLWNFGDPASAGSGGDTSTKVKPTHIYLLGGIYTVVLHVTNSHGCSDSATKTITIRTRPKARLVVANNCAHDTSVFLDSSIATSGTITARKLFFADGDSAITTGAKHVYKKFGTYTAKLIVTSSFGCLDSTKTTFTVFQKPKAGFTSPAVCVYDSAAFKDTSKIDSGSVIAWNWNLGDSKASAQQNPVHGYASDGSYAVTLVIASNKGCKDTAKHNITINPKPVADFTFTNTCKVDSMHFTDKSNGKSSTVAGWLWDFGDPASASNISTIQNPAHLYSQSGTYTVKLVSTTNKACKDSITKPVTSYPMPKAGFTKSNVCNGNAVSFLDTSVTFPGISITWFWSFGDPASGGTGGTSAVKNPVHTYSGPGTYKIKLVVTSTFGCKDSTTDSVTVYPKPKAGFKATTECFKDSTRFTDTSKVSTGSLVAWQWDFGDGTTSVLQNPVHLYTASGTYSVKLIITTNKGCGDTIARNVIVYPKPKSTFSFSNSCLVDSVTFTDASVVSSGTIVSRSWNFGDAASGAGNNISALLNPRHKFSADNTYQVTEIVTTDKGCRDTLLQTITIFPMPKAGFTTGAVCVYNNAAFANTSTINSGTMTYAWNFGDPLPAGTSTLSNPLHLYASGGTYNVKLVATSDKGCRDSVTNTQIINYKPVPGFTFTNGCQVDSVHFTDKTTIPLGTLQQWQWDFGDPAAAGTSGTSANQNPVHLYANPGTYNVRLVSITADGCRDTVIKAITIYPMPKAGFKKSNICFGNAVLFTDTAKVSSGTITAWSWSFGDPASGANGKSTNQNPSHAFTKAGTYKIKEIVSTSFGCKDSVLDSVTIYPKPKAGFSANTACFNDTTHFNDTSKVSMGNIISWQWDFGDGSVSATRNPFHIYGVSGTYTVTLTITTDKGCGDTIVKKVDVFPKPKAFFIFNNSCRRDSVLFTDKSSVSSGSLTADSWDFGDGSKSTKQNPYHKYATEGTYTVTLIIQTDKSCGDTFKSKIVIYPMPNAGFTASNICQYDSMIFSNASTISSGTMSYTWNFGDPASVANTSALASPKHKFSADGTYSVRLIAQSDKGCLDTIIKTFIVYPKAKAAFSYSNICKVDSMHFKDNSTVHTGGIVAWNWDFADGQNSTLQNPVHLFAFSGTYKVRLVATTDKGCTDTVFNSVTVYPMPKTAFLAPNVCYGISASFKDISTVSSGNITNWSWNFGDPASGGVGINTSTLQNPTHFYKASGTYTVKLVITTGFGCGDSLTKTIIINPKPKASATASTECYVNPTRFTDGSTVSSGKVTGWTWDFGDAGSPANASILQNPTHIYKAGTYNAILRISTDSGCLDTFTLKNILINPKPLSLFKVGDVCQVDSAVFANLSNVATGAIVQYKWDFGDPASGISNTSKLTNPKHKFSGPGTFTITLYATSDKGCMDTSTQQLIIHPMPKAKFGAAPQCQGLPVAFKDSSSVLTGKIVGWKWYFGDPTLSGTGGGTSTDSLPVHIYSKNDTVTVKLVVTTMFGCKDSTTRKQVIWPLPKTDFKFIVECVYDSFSFVDISTISSGKIISWAWDFADAASLNNTSAKQNPRHLFSTDGVFKVRLVTTSSFGCTDTTYHNVVVNPKPNTHWGAEPVCFKYDMKFLDSSDIHSGKIVARKWYFGDPVSGGTSEATSTATNPIHHYTRPDTFVVKLVTFSDKGCKDSLSHIVIVHPLPVSKWTHTTVCERDSTYFTDKSAIRSGAVTAWLWQFGDGATSVRQSPGHIYPAPGTYKARLIAISSYGCTDTSKYQDIIVYPRSVPKYTVQPVCWRDTSIFNNGTSIKIGGTVKSYLWDFGDTATNVLANPVHLYRYPATFKVSLVTTTDKGCTDTFRRNAVVYHWPVVNFDPSTLCLGDTIHFKNLSTSVDGTITRYHWDFGDKDTSRDAAPKHIYKKKGYYDITLNAYTSLGCMNKLTKRIHVLKRTPLFAVSDTLTCLNKPIQYTDKSISDTTLVQWSWDFGDGNTAAQQNPVHAYKVSGHFTVSLTITDLTGCPGTIVKKNLIEILDTIPPRPSPIFRATVSSDNSVNISYQKYRKYDFGSYILERLVGGVYTPIYTSTNPNDTVFEDMVPATTLKNTFSYKLLVRDLCGYFYAIDSSVTHTTMNVTGTTAINKAVLNWTPYIGWNFVKRYVIYRQYVYNLAEWDSIGWVPGDLTNYEDTAIICYRTHHYKIKAVEQGGFNQFSYSDTTAVTPIYVPNVLKNDVVRATVEPDNTVLVEWTPSKTKRPWTYILERSWDKKNFKKIGFYDRNIFHAYDQNENVNDTSYTYRMIVKDSCGDTSSYTNIAKTILLKINTASTEGHPVLNWTPYEKWPQDVDYYEVQWFSDAAKSWKTIGTTTAIDSQFIDGITSAKQAMYCYRIIGFSRADNKIVSVSNQSCMPTVMHVHVPNAFTPNADLHNETFNAKGVFVFEYDMTIYNRWGEKMFETHDLNKGWDGTFEGAEAPEGVYIYMIYARGSNAQTYSKPGNITLMR
jgi:gliding motility-associated-like protein